MFRLNKQSYLFILLLIYVDCFKILPIGYIFAQKSGLFSLAAAILWLLFGVKYFYNGNNRFLSHYRNHLPVIYIFTGIFLSFISAELFFNQSFIQSLVTSRNMLLFGTISALLYVAPTDRDVFRATFNFAIVYILVTFAKKYVPYQFYYVSNQEAIDQLIALSRGGDISVRIQSGFTTLLFPFVWYCVRLTRNFKWAYFIIASTFLIFLLMLENRSVLFLSAGIFTYSLYRIKSKYKVSLLIFFVCLLSLFITQTADQWNSLINETEQQVFDSEYNRNKSINYFLYEASPNLFCLIFGNGKLSDKTSNVMENLRLEGIYNSDVGLIGFWNWYGVIPVCVILYYALLPFFRRNKFPLVIIILGITIVVWGLTLSFYGLKEHLLFFLLYLYLVLYYKTGYKPQID